MDKRIHSFCGAFLGVFLIRLGVPLFAIGLAIVVSPLGEKEVFVGVSMLGTLFFPLRRPCLFSFSWSKRVRGFVLRMSEDALALSLFSGRKEGKIIPSLFS